MICKDQFWSGEIRLLVSSFFRLWLLEDWSVSGVPSVSFRPHLNGLVATVPTLPPDGYFYSKLVKPGKMEINLMFQPETQQSLVNFVILFIEIDRDRHFIATILRSRCCPTIEWIHFPSLRTANTINTVCYLILTVKLKTEVCFPASQLPILCCLTTALSYLLELLDFQYWICPKNQTCSPTEV